MAGGVAGAVSRTVVSPLERLKILYQVQSAGRNEYKMSIAKALKKMWTDEGWRGFMRGNGTNCIRIIPYSAVQFSSYNVYKKFAEPEPGAELTPFRRLICGGCAGITSVTFTYPLDIVRTRLSIQSASFAALGKPQGHLPGMMQTMVNMYKTEGGVFGLYSGIIPTIAGVAPYVSHVCHLLYPTYNSRYLGRLEFHGVRVCTKVLYGAWREESCLVQETCCRCHFRSGSTNLHISIVSIRCA